MGFINQLVLVGGIPTPLKNMSSSVGMMKFPVYGKKQCSKPPTRYALCSQFKIFWKISCGQCITQQVTSIF